ncbi:MAG: ISAzo13 family transposase [Chloroflexi bacterium]|nr:ISAzo13 family transposase [Chloroflexota bacterium]
MEALLEDETAGDPVRGTKWTRKTLDKLAAGLKRRKFRIGRETVRRLLRRLKYAPRANRKRLSQKQDADRDRQMRYIARIRHAYERAGKPVISVDTKKKELIGNFRNAGCTWRQAPLEVLSTDFPSDAQGKAIPYGIYDVAHNAGFVVIGTSHETAAFAVHAIRRWWRHDGRRLFPNQVELLILADGGGANSYRSGLWKWALQHFADESGLTLRVMHYPTSASKWNLIEHRLFSYISGNWAGHPLTSYETVLKFIRTTKTAQGLCCKAYLDATDYATDLKVTPEQKANINLISHKVLPKWNYTIKPHASTGRK